MIKFYYSLDLFLLFTLDCSNSSYICNNDDDDNITVVEKPCMPRRFPGSNSIVCVCNATYCDNYLRSAPTSNYDCKQTTSSMAGERYNKSNCSVRDGHLSFLDIATIIRNDVNLIVAKVNTAIRCQQLFQGFGTALTDAAGYLIYSLSGAASHNLLTSYYGKHGNRYVFVRLAVAGTDFSTRFYTYNDNYPNGTTNLTTEDYLYKLPYLKKIIQIMNSTDTSGDCCRVLKMVFSCWSPPLGMKTVNTTSGISTLKGTPEVYRDYAKYLTDAIRFYEEILEHKVFALAAVNEPFNGRVGLVAINSLGMTPAQLDVLIKNYLCGQLKSDNLSHVKIIFHDDQTILAVESLPQLSQEALACISYIGIHGYTDSFTPALGAVLDYIVSVKPALGTEYCEGANPWDKAVDLGSWSRGEDYGASIILKLLHCLIAWIDWNMSLDPNGGFTYINNTVDSPIIVNVTADEFYKNPMFYFMGHFSMFVPPCSVRIEMKLYPLDINLTSIKYIAFLTPKGFIVIIIQNEGSDSKTVVVVVDEARIVTIHAPARSIVTAEIKDTTSSQANA